MHCFLPKFCFVPFSFLVMTTGLVYAVLFGRLTGFYSVAVGLSFVICGFFGLLASGWRAYTSSIIFASSLVIVSVVAVCVNVGGLLFPEYVFLLSEEEDKLVIGNYSIEPANYWFGGAMFFLTLIYIPIVSIAICNACTVNKVIKRNKKRRMKMLEKQRRKDGFLSYRGNSLKNRIKPEEFVKIRKELNAVVRSTAPPKEHVEIQVE
ncbi:DUF4203 domain-containing protein [Entamoeba marina]